MKVTLNDRDREILDATGMPEELILGMKQRAFDAGDIDIDGNFIDHEDDECDGDCDNCKHGNASEDDEDDEDEDSYDEDDEDYEFTERQLDVVVTRYKEVIDESFVQAAKRLTDDILIRANTIPEEDRRAFLIAAKNGIVNIMGISSNSRQEIIAYVESKIQ